MEPLMYVIDLLCDALALRVPDSLSSGLMAKVPRGGGAAKKWKDLDRMTRTAEEKGSPNGKRIQLWLAY